MSGITDAERFAMDPENVEFTLNFLTGQVHALFMVTQMLANAQPDPVKALSLLDALEQDGIANMEALPVGDAARRIAARVLAFAVPSRRRRPGSDGTERISPERQTPLRTATTGTPGRAAADVVACEEPPYLSD